jgi:hypothetical protein
MMRRKELQGMSGNKNRVPSQAETYTGRCDELLRVDNKVALTAILRVIAKDLVVEIAQLL